MPIHRENERIKHTGIKLSSLFAKRAMRVSEKENK